MPSSLTQMLQSIFSDNNSNIMLAAIISLLLVILFVLLLHLYAQWFLSHAHHSPRRRPSSAVTVSDVIGPARFHHFHTFNNIHSSFPNSPSKGLHSSSISKIPLFVYQAHTLGQNFHDPEVECVICLSVFENGETGRILPKCRHAFHVGCIDMWLTSHSNCPICRAPILELQDHDDSSSSSAVIEVVVDSTSSEIGENDRGDDQSTSVSADDDDDDHGVGGGVSVNVSVSESVVSISETSSSLLGCSLKRMFTQVFPSSNVTELGTS